VGTARDRLDPRDDARPARQRDPRRHPARARRAGAPAAHRRLQGRRRRDGRAPFAGIPRALVADRMTADERLAALGIKLPPASNPAANYANCVRTGDLLFVSGKGPVSPGSAPPKGRLGREFSTRDGYDLARFTALDILAAVQLELGSLDRVRRVV